MVLETRRGSTPLSIVLMLGLGCGDASTPESPAPDAGSRDAAPSGPDAGAPGADAGMETPGADAGPSLAPFGLDERPPNPTCRAPARPPAGSVRVRLTAAYEAAGRFERPLALEPLPGSPGVAWSIEQPGRIHRVEEGQPRALVLDLSDRVDDGPSEGGLLGLAFHPRFEENGRVFLAYTARTGGAFVSRLVEMASPNRTDLDPGSERLVHEVPQPAGNHNGGAIAFGPDGRLYYALGDGGGAGDTFGHGQNRDTVLGAILRLDVDAGTPYAVPPDNPFADGGGAPEIYAWGFRNPWRITFDRATGDLWAGDVGQNAVEEIDRVVLGGNYGWNRKEGSRCYAPRSGCEIPGLIDPVVEYPHAEGRSVTGGYVYRGTAIPDLRGAYVFGDFVSGRIWAARGDPETGEWTSTLLLESGINIASFAQDEDGELLVLDYAGSIRRLEPDGAPDPSPFPSRLSETGCVRPDDPRAPAPGLLPYVPNAPLWSDGAEKIRYLALPDGVTVEVTAEGDFVLPPGTVTLKHFVLDGTYVETRLFVRHDDGGWAGYSYAWNPEQTEARLVDGRLRARWGDRDWVHPSRAECLACHTEAAGRSLGLELGQLDGLLTYPSTGRRANQLATWSHIGLFAAEPPPAPRLPSYDEPGAPVADRAKAWLHTNCSVCHRPGGTGRGEMDLRFATALDRMRVCDVEGLHGDLGLAEPRLLAPAAPERSLLVERSQRLDAARMPPLASEVVDAVGLDLLDEWIRTIPSCP